MHSLQSDGQTEGMRGPVAAQSHQQIGSRGRIQALPGSPTDAALATSTQGPCVFLQELGSTVPKVPFSSKAL